MDAEKSSLYICGSVLGSIPTKENTPCEISLFRKYY